LEPWEKVLVLQEGFQEDPHNQMRCDFCHGGTQAPGKEDAHVDLSLTPVAVKHRFAVAVIRLKIVLSKIACIPRRKAIGRR